jgi:hypothetical protein
MGLKKQPLWADSWLQAIGFWLQAANFCYKPPLWAAARGKTNSM